MKCPYGGYEAPVGKNQIWVDTVFTVKEDHVPWLKQQLKAKDELIEWYERRVDNLINVITKRDTEIKALKGE